MIKVALFLFIMITLIACGQKVHENISESFYEDTKYAMDTLDQAFEESKELTSDEQKGIEHYKMKYEDREISIGTPMTDEEERLFITVNKMIDAFELSTGLPSDKETFNSFKGWANEIIEKGTFID